VLCIVAKKEKLQKFKLFHRQALSSLFDKCLALFGLS